MKSSEPLNVFFKNKPSKILQYKISQINNRYENDAGKEKFKLSEKNKQNNSKIYKQKDYFKPLKIIPLLLSYINLY